MEGYETKDISPNVEEEIVIDVDTPDENGDLKEAIHARVKDISKTHINSIYGVYGIGMNRGSMLLYCENDVRETCRTFRRMFYSNNMLKRHHIPMRRGER